MPRVRTARVRLVVAAGDLRQRGAGDVDQTGHPVGVETHLSGLDPVVSRKEEREPLPPLVAAGVQGERRLVEPRQRPRSAEVVDEPERRACRRLLLAVPHDDRDLLDVHDDAADGQDAQHAPLPRLVRHLQGEVEPTRVSVPDGTDAGRTRHTERAVGSDPQLTCGQHLQGHALARVREHDDVDQLPSDPGRQRERVHGRRQYLTRVRTDADGQPDMAAGQHARQVLRSSRGGEQGDVDVRAQVRRVLRGRRDRTTRTQSVEQRHPLDDRAARPGRLSLLGSLAHQTFMNVPLDGFRIRGQLLDARKGFIPEKAPQKPVRRPNDINSGVSSRPDEVGLAVPRAVEQARRSRRHVLGGRRTDGDHERVDRHAEDQGVRRTLLVDRRASTQEHVEAEVTPLAAQRRAQRPQLVDPGALEQRRRQRDLPGLVQGADRRLPEHLEHIALGDHPDSSPRRRRLSLAATLRRKSLGRSMMFRNARSSRFGPCARAIRTFRGNCRRPDRIRLAWIIGRSARAL